MFVCGCQCVRLVRSKSSCMSSPPPKKKMTAPCTLHVTPCTFNPRTHRVLARTNPPLTHLPDTLHASDRVCACARVYCVRVCACVCARACMILSLSIYLSIYLSLSISLSLYLSLSLRVRRLRSIRIDAVLTPFQFRLIIDPDAHAHFDELRSLSASLSLSHTHTHKHTRAHTPPTWTVKDMSHHEPP